MSLVYYQPTSEADAVINPLIAKFMENSPGVDQLNFNLTPYNSGKNPIFKVSDAESLLQKTNIRQTIDRDQKKSIDERAFTLGEHFVYGLALSSNNSKRKTLFFTVDGFETYLMMSYGKVSNLYRKFVLVVMRELRQTGMVTLENAIKKTEKLYKKEIQEVNKMLTHTNKVLAIEQSKRFEAETFLIETEIDRDSLKIISEHHRRKVHKAMEYQDNLTEDFPSNKEDELNILKKKYLKPLKIYIIPFEKVQKEIKNTRSYKKSKKPKNKIYKYLSAAKVKELGLDDSSDDEKNSVDSFVLEYDYSMFGTLHKPHPDDQYYYTISMSKNLSNRIGIYVGDLYITGKEHFDELVSYLKENCETPLRGTFTISITELEDKVREIFIIQNNRSGFNRPL
jgi:hypothetical protein